MKSCEKGHHTENLSHTITWGSPPNMKVIDENILLHKFIVLRVFFTNYDMHLVMPLIHCTVVPRWHHAQQPDILLQLPEILTSKNSKLRTSTLNTMGPALRDYCHVRPPVLNDHTLLAGPTFQCNWTCHQRLALLRNHMFMACGAVFQDRFHCTRYIKNELFKGPFAFVLPHICLGLNEVFLSVTIRKCKI